MTLLGGLSRRSLENPNIPLSSTSLAEYLFGSKSGSGVAVTERRVLGLPAYWRAASLTAGTLATLPLKTYKVGSRQKVQRRTVLDAPNPRQTPAEYKLTSFLHAITWGNMVSRKVRDGSGLVREVWPIHPGCVRVEPVEPTAADPAGKLFIVTVRGQETRLTSRDILHVPMVSADGVVGVRPLEVFRQSLGIAIAGDDATAKFIANGSRLSGILSTDQKLEDSSARKLKARWKELTGGVDNSGEIGVLDGGATFTPVSIPPADAQMLEGRTWSVAEIARMVGTPPHMIGDMTNSTSWGTGLEQQVLGWVKFTLQLFITVTEQRWTSELLGADEYYEHSLEGLLRGDAASRAAFYQRSIQDGWRTRNEVRDLENLEPAEGLDEFIVPSNMTLISVDGTLVPLSSAGVADTTPSPTG